MSYCDQHGINYSGHICPHCIEEQRHEDVLETVANAARWSEYKHANPGDYECPHCKYITLKRDATRCPRCHGDIDINYWQTILAKEKEAKAAIARAKAEESARVARLKEAVSSGDRVGILLNETLSDACDRYARERISARNRYIIFAVLAALAIVSVGIFVF